MSIKDFILGRMQSELHRVHANFASDNKHQGPVVQSIVYLTSSLRGQIVKCFMTL